LVADCVPIVLYDPGRPRARLRARRLGGARSPGRRRRRWRRCARSAPGRRTSSPASAPRSRPAPTRVGEEVARAARDAFGEEVAAARRTPWARNWPARRGTRSASRRRALLPAGPGRRPRPMAVRPPGRQPARPAHGGVPDGQIHVAATPTGPRPGLFFSHRAERPCGRFALAARLEPRGQR
jgi:hypothetical protein